MVLEKFFRTFSQLNKLNFYIRYLQSINHVLQNNESDYFYRIPFTSRFCRDRSIKVFTHFVCELRQRYIYTVPFAFDTFDIVGDIYLFFLPPYPYNYTNVHHLTLSSTSTLNELTYSREILEFFPNIQTITLVDKPSSNTTINILNNHRWVLQK